MSCKLPVISSSTAGAAHDLIVDGINGFIIEPGNSRQLATKINNILNNPKRMRRMGKMSWEIIQHYTPEKCAHGLAEAIRGGKNPSSKWSLLSEQNRELYLKKIAKIPEIFYVK